jgi:hypothetical protein
MNMCREHGQPSRNQKPGAKSGDCAWCATAQPRKKKSKPLKAKAEAVEPELYLT